MSKNKIIIICTVVLATASAVLLALKTGIFRKKELNTPFEAVQLAPATTQGSFAPIEDWPRWRGPRGDGISREVAGERWPAEGLKRLWSWKVGLGFSSPVAANGRVYLFSLKDGKDFLACFDAVTGNQIWGEGSDAGWTEDYEGARATPTIDGDSIYTYGGRGELTCRDIANGKQRWTMNVLSATGNTSPQWGQASSPLVENGLVYVQAGKGGPVAVAVDQKTGALAWKSQATGVGSYAPIILADVQGTRHLIVFGGKAVYGMNPVNGQTIWQEPWDPNYDVAATTPVYRDGRLFICSGYGKGGMLLELSPGGARKVWNETDLDSKFQGVILEGDMLYGVAERGGGRLVCINWSDGKRKWRADDSAITLHAGGSIVRAAGDRAVLMSEEGMLSLVKISPTGVELVSQFEALPGVTQVWSTPLLYGGRIYVKGPRELVCFELPKP